ncbi:MAG TPA: cell division protein ZapE [Magnetospirillaceae bacterium]|jgi:cell division protein ZapE
MSGPLAAYRALLTDGTLNPDPVQAMAVTKLESLANAVVSYQPAQGQGGWLGRFGFSNHGSRQLGWMADDSGMEGVGKQGLYLYGDVGKGKSMLMDLFFDSVPVTSKKRVHFHEFMRDVQQRLYGLRQDKSVKDADPIPRLARDIAQENWLLCFDELQVTDIGDAMILGRLFEGLFENGIVLMITSNRPPDDLYKDGLQRDRFAPFIALIKERLDVLELAAERDYRMGRDRDATVYYSPASATTEATLKSQFLSLNNGKSPVADTVYVLGRKLNAPRTGDGIVWFTFDELCRSALGPSDYLALASLYRTVMLSGIPLLGPDERDAAKRFVTLIDALYEHNVHFICSAAAPPDGLYPTGDGAFEFKRTVSRLMEMQSAVYLGQQHLP